eukprot:4946996-Pyramimonas_sp.AAC.2
MWFLLGRFLTEELGLGVPTRRWPRRRSGCLRVPLRSCASASCRPSTTRTAAPRADTEADS